ncbi:MAG: efflux RND transporter permease subunit [Chloroflexi bacterium]|nr:efflux RND transporter permease subunit [Chloroflexota bacterium]
MWITAFSLRRPLVLVMATLALMIAGLIAYGRMNVDLLPSAKFPFISVTIAYPGAGPREVEERITKPLEDAAAGATNVKRITSVAGEGYGYIVAEFHDGTEPDAAMREIEQKVSLIRGQLPPESRAPVLAKFDPSSAPILILAMRGGLPVDGMQRLSEEVVKPALEAVDGVAAVSLIGGREREVHVRVDPARLAGHRLSILQVSQALQASNLSVPAGTVAVGQGEANLRVYGLHQDVEAIGNLVLMTGPTGAVLLKDVATVEEGFTRQSSISRVNGQEGLGILVQKQPTANTVAVSRGVNEALARLSSRLPGGVQIVTIADGAEFVRASLDGLNANLRDAVIITALVLLLFLHTWRATAIVLVAIPTSLIATFAVMWVAGFSINMMSMMGLALTIGILVDDSIVILENIYRHMMRGESPWAAAITGRAEIGAAAVAITLVDVIVYAPVAFLTGIVGQFFREFGLTIVVATLFSLAVSFTLTPMLCSRWLRLHGEERSPLAFLWRRWDAGYEAVVRGYRRALGWSLGHRWAIVGLGALAFFGGIALIPLGAVGTEFVTQGDQGQFTVNLTLPPGTSLERTNQVIAEFEQRLAAVPEVEAFQTAVGLGGQYGRSEHRSGRIYVRLKPKRERARSVFEVAESMQQLKPDVPGLQVRANLPNVVGIAAQPVIVRIRGDDVDTLTKLAGEVEAVVRKTPGTADVTNSSAAGLPELRIEVDHRKAADLGLTTAAVAGAIRTAYEGEVATQFRREGQDKIDIRVLFTQSEQATPESLVALPIVTPRGTTVRLGQLARIRRLDGPAQIERQDRHRQIEIGANLAGRPLGDVTADLSAAFAGLQLPAGYELSIEGETEQQQESFGSLSAALLLSLVLMYMLMVALYESFTHPLVIMLSLPLASVGAIGALALTGDTLNIMSLVGLIMLTGLVGKNAILLVDYTHTLRTRGIGRREALLEAGPTRLRPILMTTAAMVFGMLPLAMRIAEGAEIRSSMGVVVIGGLVTSTLLTLVFIPAAYTIVDDVQVWLLGKLGRRTTQPPAPAQAPESGLAEEYVRNG